MNVTKLLVTSFTAFVSLSLLVTPNALAQSKTIYERAANDKQFKTVIQAVDKAELKDTLNGSGDFTVFVPTDKAFEELGDTLEILLKDENKDLLRDVLLYHTLPTNLDQTTLQAQTPVTSVQTGTIDISTVGDSVLINGTAKVLSADIEASNGRVHVIDKVILSQDLTNRISQAANPAASATTETNQTPSMPPVTLETPETTPNVTPNTSSPATSTQNTTTEVSQEDLVRTGNSSQLLTNLINIGIAAVFILLTFAISKQVLNRTIPFKNI